MAEKADKTASPPHPLRVAVAVLAALVIAWLLLSSPTFEIPGKTIECDPIQPLLPGRVSTYDSETYDSDATREAESTPSTPAPTPTGVPGATAFRTCCCTGATWPASAGRQ